MRRPLPAFLAPGCGPSTHVGYCGYSQHPCAAELAATAAYVLGTVPWSEYDTEPDQIMGWSPADFAAR